VRELANQRCRNERRLFCILQRVRLDRRAIRIEAGGCVRDELAMLQTRGENLAADRIGERDVGADVET
jgi:hypothetical protein